MHPFQIPTAPYLIKHNRPLYAQYLKKFDVRLDWHFKCFASRRFTEQSIKLIEVHFIGYKMYFCIYTQK